MVTGEVASNLETAIHYVKQRKDETSDPVIKRNAQKTLAFLERQLAK